MIEWTGIQDEDATIGATILHARVDGTPVTVRVSVEAMHRADLGAIHATAARKIAASTRDGVPPPLIEVMVTDLHP